MMTWASLSLFDSLLDWGRQDLGALFSFSVHIALWLVCLCTHR